MIPKVIFRNLTFGICFVICFCTLLPFTHAKPTSAKRNSALVLFTKVRPTSVPWKPLASPPQNASPLLTSLESNSEQQRQAPLGDHHQKLYSVAAVKGRSVQKRWRNNYDCYQFLGCFLTAILIQNCKNGHGALVYLTL